MTARSLEDIQMDIEAAHLVIRQMIRLADQLELEYAEQAQRFAKRMKYEGYCKCAYTRVLNSNSKNRKGDIRLEINPKCLIHNPQDVDKKLDKEI